VTLTWTGVDPALDQALDGAAGLIPSPPFGNGHKDDCPFPLLA